MKKITVQKKSNDIINRLNKTKKVEFPSFAALREEYDAEVGPSIPSDGATPLEGCCCTPTRQAS